MTIPNRKLAESDGPVRIASTKLAEAFPADVDAGIIPFADRVLVQIKYVTNVSSGGIIVPDEVVKDEEDNTMIAKVIAMGSTAFRDQDTLELWPEGLWCAAGEFVRIPQYGGDRWHVKTPDPENPRFPRKIRFAMIKDLDLIGKVTGDPLKIVAFL